LCCSATQIDRIYGVCLSDPPHCRPSLPRLVGAVVLNGQTPQSATTISDLRVTVPPTVFVDEIARLAGEPVAEPRFDNLWIVPVADGPTEILTLTAKALAPQGLDGDRALESGGGLSCNASRRPRESPSTGWRTAA